MLQISKKHLAIGMLLSSFCNFLSAAEEDAKKAELSTSLPTVPSSSFAPGPHEIQYEVIYTFGGNGTKGPVRIFNNLDNTDENWVVLGLGVSDGAYKKKPQGIAGKHSYTFPRLDDGRTYTTVIREKQSGGKTGALDSSWFYEHWVTKMALDEDDKFHMGEPFMFVGVGTIPPIDFTGR